MNSSLQILEYFFGMRTFEKTNIYSPVEVDGVNDAAVIVCSSGTTGFPKGKTYKALFTYLNVESEKSVKFEFLKAKIWIS